MMGRHLNCYNLYSFLRRIYGHCGLFCCEFCLQLRAIRTPQNRGYRGSLFAQLQYDETLGNRAENTLPEAASTIGCVACNFRQN